MAKSPSAPTTRPAKLTNKQELFCHEYLACGMNASEAARRAGYAPRAAFRSGVQNMQKPAVVARITELQAATMSRVQIDAEYVLRQAMKLHEKCMTEDWWNPAGAAKGLELLGKHIDVQAFLERKDHSSKDGSMTPQINTIERVIVTITRE